jgi:hypothetical protein
MEAKRLEITLPVIQKTFINYQVQKTFQPDSDHIRSHKQARQYPSCAHAAGKAPHRFPLLTAKENRRKTGGI